MSEKNTLVRSIHDLGLAAWFGGSLMGAVGLNGAAGDTADPSEAPRLAGSGWARWAPVNAAAVGLHLVGGLVLLSANRERVRHQPGVRASSIAKTVLTVAALGTTLYSGKLGKDISSAGSVPAASGTVPNESTPGPVASAMQKQRVMQWVTPALTGAVIAVAALQGEQQRPSAVLLSGVGRAAKSLRPGTM
jgi:hypothetical protein